MTRIPHDFSSRPAAEREEMTKNTWCSHCDAPDLGLSDPIEYEEHGVRMVEGRCLRCGAKVVSTIHESDPGCQ